MNPQSSDMVDAIKISAIFSDPAVLGQIADKLMSAGLISGFHIDPVSAGYIHAGAKVLESQFSLEILLDVSSPHESRVREEILAYIGAQWNVPAIERQKVQINRGLLSFVKRAKVEHSRYTRERRFKLALIFALQVAIAVALGMTWSWMDAKAKNAVLMAQQAEREAAHKRVYELSQLIAGQIREIDAKIAAGKPLKVSPSDMAAATSYEETWQVVETVSKVEFELHKLAAKK